AAERGERDGGVRGGDSEVQHGVDGGIREELVDREGAAAGHLLCPGGSTSAIQIRRGDDAHVGMLGERLEVLSRDDADPDYSDTVRLAHSIPLSMMVRTLTSRRMTGPCPGVATKMRPWPQRRVHTAGVTAGRCHGW